MLWLLDQVTAQAMREALVAGRAPTAAACEEYRLREEAADAAAERPRNMSIGVDGVAEIRVEGVLTPKPDLFSWLFGGANTTYQQIKAALAVAAQDPSIRAVRLLVSSPGGQVDGLFDMLGAIQAFQKPMSVRAARADSAAYAIAATAGKITAENRAAEFGSIGVVVSFYNDPEIVDITSTNAPNKRPDLNTEEGKATIREYLDQLHELFVDAIATGRSAFGGEKFTVDRINSEFGRGSVFTAKRAKELGMIDSVPPTPKNVRGDQEGAPEAEHQQDSTADGGGAEERQIMDLNTLKTQHRELYEAVLKEGQEQERKRVSAHLNLGEKCCAMDIAIKAIRAGSDFDVETQSEYLAAGINKRDQSARQADSSVVGAAVSGADKTEPQAKDLVDQVADMLERGAGLKK